MFQTCFSLNFLYSLEQTLKQCSSKNFDLDNVFPVANFLELEIKLVVCFLTLSLEFAKMSVAPIHDLIFTLLPTLAN